MPPGLRSYLTVCFLFMPFTWFCYQVWRGPWMSTVVLYCWCHINSASVLLYFTFLSHLFPLPCGAGSTVPREGFDSSVIMPFSWCCGCDTSLIVSVHIQCKCLHIYTNVVSRAFMADAASQAGDADSSRAPGLISGLQGSVNVHRGALLLVPQSDSSSVLLYFTFCQTCSFCRVELVVQFPARG